MSDVTVTARDGVGQERRNVFAGLTFLLFSTGFSIRTRPNVVQCLTLEYDMKSATLNTVERWDDAMTPDPESRRLITDISTSARPNVVGSLHRGLCSDHPAPRLRWPGTLAIRPSSSAVLS